MLPDHEFSPQNVLGYLLNPDNLEPSFFIDYEMGGVGLNDPSQGSLVKVWWVQLVVDGVKEESRITINSDDTTPVLFLTAQDITEVSMAFDQNMNPLIAYMQSGDAKFYWYDSLIEDYATLVLPAGSRSPKCCLDDKRYTQRASSDVLLFYARADKLYYREQRDRYLIEYELATILPGDDVLAVGMTNVNRVQVGVGLRDYPTGTVNYRITSTGANRVTSDGRTRRLARLSYG